jgi:hypothetical protein
MTIRDTPAVLFGCVALAVACGSPPAATAPRPAPVSDVSRYLPLEHDTVFAYDTVAEQNGETGILIMHVSRPRRDMAEVKIGGRAQRLDITDNGISHATGGHLLKVPLAVGARYKGQFGEVSVTSLNKAIEVPAGKFSGCIETVEQAQTPVQKKVTTVFCPDVGMVQLIAEGMVDGDYLTERANLRSYGPRIDLGTETKP